MPAVHHGFSAALRLTDVNGPQNTTCENLLDVVEPVFARPINVQSAVTLKASMHAIHCLSMPLRWLRQVPGCGSGPHGAACCSLWHWRRQQSSHLPGDWKDSKPHAGFDNASRSTSSGGDASDTAARASCSSERTHAFRRRAGMRPQKEPSFDISLKGKRDDCSV